MTAPILAVPTSLSPSVRWARSVLIQLAAVLPLGIASLAAPAQAGPVLCTTTLEAPTTEAISTGPVEVTRCGIVRSAPEVMEDRYFTYSPPFAHGVNLLHQITDPLGLIFGGRDGGRFVGLGFPDQKIIWDGTAVENTYSVMVTDQSSPMPLRTSDITSGYGSSLGAAAADNYVRQPPATNWTPPIRGLW